MANPSKVSSAGIEEIVKHEGEILEVYEDPVGLPTLGVGHLLTPSELRAMPVGTKITKAQSREYLRKDLARFERCVTDAVRVSINQNQFDALVSLAFNIGEANFEKSSVLRLLNRRNYLDAANAFRLWNKARKNGELVVLKGLTRRRESERALFLKNPQPVTDSAADSRPSTQPAPVSGGAKDSPTAPVPASPSVSTDKGPGKGRISEVFKTVADAATNWLSTPGGKQAVAKSGSVFTLAAAYLYTNWWILLVLLFIAVVAIWYFRVRGRRSGTE